MLKLLQQVELPLAYLTLSLSVAVIVWKSVGIQWFPGWYDVFTEVGRPDAPYPRRVVEDETVWRLIYGVMYGCLGTVGQYAGLKLSIDKSSSSETMIQRARLFGLFHTIIGIHHTLWAIFIGKYGRLTLEDINVPGLHILGGICGALAGWHGLQALLSTEGVSRQEIIRHKVLCDWTTFCSLIEIFFFLPAALLGGYRGKAFEQVAWIVTFTLPLGTFVADFFEQRSSKGNKKTA